MNAHPLNLTIRFLLELMMIGVLGAWGWQLGSSSPLRFVLAIAFPLAAAILWGYFRIPNDPKPAPVEVPGIVRLLLEWILFGLTVAGLHQLGYPKAAKWLIIVLILHYAVSYDRTSAMLRNKPYRGFTNTP
ncbi:YrdB family protein [Chitinophaga sp. 30R24]|uniref:YrdB family protein n=1 Tax=Chitinophaga sp. 30R24 TaxID=3248838 RepID=UPI003B900BE4